MSFHKHELDLSVPSLKRRDVENNRVKLIDLTIPDGDIKILKVYQDAFRYQSANATYKPELYDIEIGGVLFERVWIFTNRQAGEEDAQTLIDNYNGVSLSEVKDKLIDFLETLIEYLKNE